MTTDSPPPRNCDDYAPGSNARMTCLADRVEWYANNIDRNVQNIKLCAVVIVIFALLNLVIALSYEGIVP